MLRRFLSFGDADVEKIITCEMIVLMSYVADDTYDMIVMIRTQHSRKSLTL